MDQNDGAPRLQSRSLLATAFMTSVINRRQLRQHPWARPWSETESPRRRCVVVRQRYYGLITYDGRSTAARNCTAKLRSDNTARIWPLVKLAEVASAGGDVVGVGVAVDGDGR